MTTPTIVRPAAMLPPVQVAPSTSLTRLTQVELRKLTDTRANRWLLLITLLGCIAGGLLWQQIVKDAPTPLPWTSAVEFVSAPSAVLLPVVAILAFTTEYTQRTALTTFTMEPRRGRVIVGKLIAILIVTLGAFLVALALSAGFAALAGSNITWGFEGAPLASSLLSLAISMAMGAGFGMLLMNSPAAIALYFVLPSLTGALSMAPGVIGTIGTWISGATWSLVFTPMTATQWGQAIVAFIVWVAIPMGAGIVRTIRSEVK